MRIGVCAAPGTVTAPVARLDYMEGPVANLLCPAMDEATFQARLSAARKTPAAYEAANCLFPAQIKTAGPAVNEPAALEHFRTVCRRAAAAGIGIIVYGSGGSRALPDGFPVSVAEDNFIVLLEKLGQIAAEYAATIALEPLRRAECNFINRVEDGARIVARVGHPNVRLLADTYHMMQEKEGPDAIRRAGRWIVHAHCAESVGRGPLSAGGQDQRPYFRALKDAGYTGGVSIEAGWTDLPGQLPAALAELRLQIDTA